MKADAYAYRDRRNRKRDFRRLWITRINAAARECGMSYSQLIHGLQLAGISSTARCSPTSPCATPRPSADLPTPPARLRLPDARTPNASTSRAPLLKDGALFCANDDHLHDKPTPHRDPQARARERPRANAAASSSRARIFMRRLPPPEFHRSMCCARRAIVGRDATAGSRWRRRCWPSVSALGSGSRADRRLRAALGARRPGRSRSRCGASATRATSARSSARRTPSARRAWRSARAAPTRYGPQGRARVDGGDLLRRSLARVGGLAELPGRWSALVPGAGEPLRGPARR